MTDNHVDPAAPQVPASVSLQDLVVQWRTKADVLYERAEHEPQADATLIRGRAFRQCADDLHAALQGQVPASVSPEGPTQADLVTCSLRYPDWVCHLPHAECAIHEPHHIDTCGRFLQKRPAGDARQPTALPEIKNDDEQRDLARVDGLPK